MLCVFFFFIYFFFLIIRRPPRSTLDRSSAASDVYKRQDLGSPFLSNRARQLPFETTAALEPFAIDYIDLDPVSYTHLRAHETVLDLVCRLLLEKQKQQHNTHESCKSVCRQRPQKQILVMRPRATNTPTYMKQ